MLTEPKIHAPHKQDVARFVVEIPRDLNRRLNEYKSKTRTSKCAFLCAAADEKLTGLGVK